MTRQVSMLVSSAVLHFRQTSSEDYYIQTPPEDLHKFASWTPPWTCACMDIVRRVKAFYVDTEKHMSEISAKCVQVRWMFHGLGRQALYQKHRANPARESSASNDET